MNIFGNLFVAGTREFEKLHETRDILVERIPLYNDNNDKSNEF